MLGYHSEEDFPNEVNTFMDLVHHEERDVIFEAMLRSINDRSNKTAYDERFRIFTRDRGYRWFRATGRFSRRPDGSAIKLVGLFMDIDDAKKAEDRLSAQLDIVKALSRDYLNVYTININERLIEAIKVDGIQIDKTDSGDEHKATYESLIRQYIKSCVYPEDQSKMFELMKLDNVLKKLEDKYEYESGYRVLEDGQIHYYQFKFIKMLEHENRNQIIVGFKNVDDIVNAAREIESLKILSETDSMTGLLNRGSGEKRATEAIGAKKKGMFCILDIDKFKSINDTYGHAIGDKVILNVAKCLKDAFRENDIVFRLGGDEFAVFACGEIDEESGQKIFDRFFKKLDSLHIDEMGDRKVTTSIGASIVSDDETLKFEELYKATDACVYMSKKLDGNAVNFTEELR